MKIRFLLLLMAAMTVVFLTIFTGLAAADPVLSPLKGAQNAGGLQFVPNEGQFAREVTYQVLGGAQTAWLTADSLWLALSDDAGARTTSVRLRFAGPEQGLRMEPFARRPGIMNYLGGDASHSQVPIWGGVRLLDSNDNVLLRVAGEKGGLSLLADESLTLELEGARIIAVQDSMATLDTALGRALVPLPFVDNGGRLSGLNQDGKNAQWQLSARSDSQHNLAPSDVLQYSTFIGGELLDRANAIALDSEGAAYVTGHTQSLAFPSGPGRIATVHGVDVYVAKLSATGSALDYVTWINPNPGQADDTDYGYDIAVNSAGNAFVVGATLTPEFCEFLGSPPGFDTTHNGNDDGFMFRLTADGSAADFCSYVGGSETDIANAVAVDEDDNVYVAGGTWSEDFPTTRSAFSEELAGSRDAFITLFSAAGTTQIWGTYVGGSTQEEITDLVIDGDGNAYAVGWTNSDDLPTTLGAYEVDFQGVFDAFVLKLNDAGTDLVFATYLGGDTEDRGYAIRLTDAGQTFVTGRTLSTDFPITSDGYDITHNGVYDLFVSGFDAAGAELIYGTFVGGSDIDTGRALALDGAGGIYLTGETSSEDFPLSACPFDGALGGTSDAFATVIRMGETLEYSSYLGGDMADYGSGLQLDQSNDMVLAGRTDSSDFPTTAGAYDQQHNGDYDIFVTKLASELGICTQQFLPLMLKP